jgi:pyruvate kinase
MRRTKIVATVGPASRDPEVLVRMVEAGMDVVRLNFSHGTHEEHAKTVELVRNAAGRAGRPVAILQDLPGPKLRIGPVQDGRIDLLRGAKVTISCGAEEILGTPEHLWLSWPGLAAAIAPGELLYLADGAVRLVATATRPGDAEVDCEVEIGGSVVSRQGLNIPGPVDELPSVPEEDLVHLRAGIAMGVDIVALSFVRRPEDLHFVREHTRAPLVAKVEKPQAVDRMEEIIQASDCIMVARGDLGIELPLQEVPLVQKRLIRVAGSMARPTITATQMLDSMVTAARPTRAEVTDVANAILDGTDAVMLSQETAVGAHPIGAVAMLDSIARTTERELPYEIWNESRVKRDGRDPSYTVAHAACEAARDLQLDALIVPTLSGRSARLVSAHRPNVPIYVLSPGRETVRRCGLMWGVQAASQKRHEVTEELIADAARRVVELGWCRPGMRVGITAGLPSGRPGTTSLFQVQEL